MEKCPEVWIEVDTPYDKGKVVALVLNTPFADLIVGNYTRVDIPVKKESRSVDKEDEKCQAMETRLTFKKRKVEEEVLDGYVFGKDFSKKDLIAEQQKDPTLEVKRNNSSRREEVFINGKSYVVPKFQIINGRHHEAISGASKVPQTDSLTRACHSDAWSPLDEEDQKPDYETFLLARYL